MPVQAKSPSKVILSPRDLTVIGQWTSSHPYHCFEESLTHMLSGIRSDVEQDGEAHVTPSGLAAVIPRSKFVRRFEVLRLPAPYTACRVFRDMLRSCLHHPTEHISREFGSALASTFVRDFES